MKNFRFLSFWLLLTLGMSTIVFYSCSKDDNSKGQTSDPTHQDNGVVINGIKWATRNVASPGTFADKPEDVGMFYQWNRKAAWPATGNVAGWDSIMPIGANWGTDTDPSPAGWRPPTTVEIQTLVDSTKVSSEWVAENGINGRRFTDKASGNSIFLPAAGLRNYPDGMLYGVPAGYYWGRTGINNTDYAFGLYFDLNKVFFASLSRAYGFIIRCVAE